MKSKMNTLESEVHNCTKCKQKQLGIKMCYPPVYSFGNPSGKPVILIGLNPSRKEFEPTNGEPFLSSSENPNTRRTSQMDYFDSDPHTYFEKIVPFFEGPVKKKLGYEENPWDTVGVLDLVKCVTVRKNRQWSKLNDGQKDDLIGNCEIHLIRQLKRYKPKVVIPYGVDVCKWFREYDPQNTLSKKDPIDGYTTFNAIIEDESYQGLYIPQRQGPHSRPEIEWVQKKLARLL